MFLVVIEFYGSIYSKIFEIDDIIMLLFQMHFWESICFLVDPYYQVLVYLMIHSC